MKLQRYDIEPGSESMQPFPDGEYLKLSEALDWFESLLPADGSMLPDDSVKGFTDIQRERTRLRSLIAAERGE